MTKGYSASMWNSEAGLRYVPLTKEGAKLKNRANVQFQKRSNRSKKYTELSKAGPVKFVDTTGWTREQIKAAMITGINPITGRKLPREVVFGYTDAPEFIRMPLKLKATGWRFAVCSNNGRSATCKPADWSLANRVAMAKMPSDAQVDARESFAALSKKVAKDWRKKTPEQKAAAGGWAAWRKTQYKNKDYKPRSNNVIIDSAAPKGAYQMVDNDNNVIVAGQIRNAPAYRPAAARRKANGTPGTWVEYRDGSVKRESSTMTGGAAAARPRSRALELVSPNIEDENYDSEESEMEM